MTSLRVIDPQCTKLSGPWRAGVQGAGSGVTPVVVISGTGGTVPRNSCLVSMISTGAGLTITLPAVSGAGGLCYSFRVRTNTGTGNISIQATGPVLVGCAYNVRGSGGGFLQTGATYFTGCTMNYQSIPGEGPDIMCDGSNYYIKGWSVNTGAASGCYIGFQ